tara:strand:+ start:524 stop:682 length:159 start_codon:yes stop_codon:yes gene_type:complete
MNNKTPKEIVEYARANPHTVEVEASSCCGAEHSHLSDSICSSCLEHADFKSL